MLTINLSALYFSKIQKKKHLKVQVMMLARMHTEDKAHVLNENAPHGMELTLWTQSSYTPTIKGKNLYS